MALVTLWAKDRADRRMLGVERDKVAVSARGVEVSAASVVVQERTADASVLDAMTRSYQGLIAAQKDRIDGLEGRLRAVEDREQHCLKRVDDLEAEQGRLQAALWRLRNTGNG